MSASAFLSSWWRELALGAAFLLMALLQIRTYRMVRKVLGIRGAWKRMGDLYKKVLGLGCAL